MNFEVIGVFLAAWFVIACGVYFVNESLYSSATFGGYNIYGKILIAPLLVINYLIELFRLPEAASFLIKLFVGLRVLSKTDLQKEGEEA